MSVGDSWSQKFKISEANLQAWKTEAGPGVDLLAWCLLTGKINEDEYLNWASQHHELPVLSNDYFSLPPDLKFWEEAKQAGPWNSSLIPLNRWDNAWMIACVSPENLPPLPQPHRLVLASARAMKLLWVTLNDGVDAAPTSVEAVAVAVAPAAQPVALNFNLSPTPPPAIAIPEVALSEPISAPPPSASPPPLAAEVSPASSPLDFKLNFSLETAPPPPPPSIGVVEMPSPTMPTPPDPVSAPSAPSPGDLASFLSQPVPPPPVAPSIEGTSSVSETSFSEGALSQTQAIAADELLKRVDIPEPHFAELTIPKTMVDIDFGSMQTASAEESNNEPEPTAQAAKAAEPEAPSKMGVLVGEPREEKPKVTAETRPADAAPVAKPTSTTKKPTTKPTSTLESKVVHHIPQAPALPEEALQPAEDTPTPSSEHPTNEKETQPSFSYKSVIHRVKELEATRTIDLNQLEQSKTKKRPKLAATDFPHCNNYEEVVEVAFRKMADLFEKSVMLIFQGGELRPWRWTASVGRDQKNKASKISLETPSIFRIVFRTRLPYHGYVVGNPINSAFFAEMNAGEVPPHVTIMPVMIQDQIAGMLMGISNAPVDLRTSLRQMEHITDGVNEAFKRIRANKAA